MVRFDEHGSTRAGGGDGELSTGNIFVIPYILSRIFVRIICPCIGPGCGKYLHDDICLIIIGAYKTYIISSNTIIRALRSLHAFFINKLARNIIIVGAFNESFNAVTCQW